MHRLRTFLTPEECIERLREQTQPLSLLARVNIVRAPTSPVLGRISGDTIALESSRDAFSKRFVGRLRRTDAGTTIEYVWKAGRNHRFWGDADFDEEEILSFLAEWLETQEA